MKLKDDVYVVYQRFGGILTIGFPDGKVLVVSGVCDLVVSISFSTDASMYSKANLDCIELADGFLFSVCSSRLGDKTLLVAAIAEVSRLAQIRLENDARATTSLQDIILCSKPLRPQYKSMQKATLTLNTLHWKREHERDRIIATIYVAFKDLIGTEMEAPCASFTFFKDATLPAQSRLIFNPPAVHSPSTSSLSCPQASYVSFTPPTLSRYMLTLLCYSDETNYPGLENALALARLSAKGPTMFKPLEPRERNLLYPYDWYVASMDAYSNTMALSTGRHEEIIVRRYE